MEKDRQILYGVLNSSQVGLVLLDAGRKIVLWNKWMSLASGIDETDAAGHTLDELFGGQVDPDIFVAIDDAFKHGVSSLLSQALHKWPLPLYVRKTDIAEPMDQVIYVTLVDLPGSETYCLIQVTDTTTTIRRENMLREQSRHAREARLLAEQANRAKSVFLSNMSHELRTPLNAILGFAELIKTDPAITLGRENQEAIQEIHKAGLHLLDLVGDLLDLSKIEAGKVDIVFENVQVQDVIQDVVSFIRPIAQRSNVKVACHAGDDTLEVYVDRRRFRQVLLNLMSNAVKYNRKDGTVTIDCDFDQGANTVTLRVADTGVGISSMHIGKIFEPFHRIRSGEALNIEGTGIGLTITKHLVCSMGGEIGVESVIGDGSVFWVTFPARQSSADGYPAASGVETMLGAPVMADGNQATLVRAKVLLAEDNLANQKVILRMLKTLGYDVQITNNGKQALQMLDHYRHRLVLMDMQMPEMGGIDAAVAIRKMEEQQQLPRIPIVALTANAMMEDQEKCFSVGMDDYIMKPVSIETLRKALDRWIE